MSTLVSDWGWCDDCGALRDLIEPCEHCGYDCVSGDDRYRAIEVLCQRLLAEHRGLDPDQIAQAVDQVTDPRPKRIKFIEEGNNTNYGATTLVVGIPRIRQCPRHGTRRRRQKIARIANHIAQHFLDKGFSLTGCVDKLVLGATSIRRELHRRYGITASETTIRTDLAWLFGDHVGHLKPWVDIHAPGPYVERKGAFTYQLNAAIGEFTAKARDHLDRLLGRGGHSAPKTAGSTPTSPEDRLRGWLRGLINHARVGNREHGAYILTRRCIDHAQDYEQALDWVKSYWRGIRHIGSNSDPITWGELKGVVTRTYRAHRRIPDTRRLTPGW
jgi:hypothetical protein